VITFGWTGGWAELRAVSTADLAVVPAEVDLGAASTLPAAGVTALHSATSSSSWRRKLDPQIGWRGEWDRAPEAARALLAREFTGRAVLDVTPTREGAS